MIDSHCHLADEAFVLDMAEVIDRALAGGVTAGLCILDAFEAVEVERYLAAAARWPALRASVGIHPHRARACTGRVTELVAHLDRALAVAPRCRAIGEVGLDYHYDFSTPAEQLEVFEAQVAMALARDLPLVIHTREADDDTVRVLRDAGHGRVRGVFHCFSGTVALARAALDLGFMVSFSGIVSFPKASDVQAAARFVPDDRLLIETDCPYLAPVPHRGRRNEPAWVCHVADAIARLRGVDRASISALTTHNFHRMFAP